MFKRLSYLFCCLFVFFSCIPLFGALDKDYQYYCEYQVYVDKDDPTSIDQVNGRFSFDMQAVVYKDGTAKFYSGDKEIKFNMAAGNINSYLNSYVLSIIGSDFYNAVNENEMCPDLGIEKQGAGDVSILYFKFGELNDNVILAEKVTDKPSFNPKLSDAEKGIVNTCGPYYYNYSLQGMPFYLKIQFVSYENGNKFIEIYDETNKIPLSKEYDNVNTVNFGIEGGYSLRFYPGEADKFFSNTCPIYSDFIVRKSDNGSHMFITLDKATADKNGSNTESGFNGKLDDKLSVKGGDTTGSNIGIFKGFDKELCTKYLGSVDDDEDSVAKMLDQVYTLIKIGSILIVIVLGMIEFAQVITKSNDDLMNTVKKFAKRLIILVIILLLPTFIDILGNMFGIKDILCGIK